MAQSLHELVNARFGVQTRAEVNPEAATVGVAAAILFRADSRRLAFTIVNLSAGNVFVGPFNDVAVSKGWRLGPNGGTLSMVFDEDFHLPGLEWWAVAALAASDVLSVATIVEPGGG